MPRTWYKKLVNPVDTKTNNRQNPRTTSYWDEFRTPPPSDLARISPPDTAFFRLHWTATSTSEGLEAGDLLFLVQSLRAKTDRKGFSPARAEAIGDKPILVTHLVELLDDKPLDLPDEWHARRVRAWFSAPYRVAPTTEELLELPRCDIMDGRALELSEPDPPDDDWRRRVLARLELLHLL
ncbi:hypothetical protein ACNOYE_27495 [Nannocystaceae bacterium ST9]